jgi:outer membrane protein OmpA-like peptidoglycan-associated protein
MGCLLAGLCGWISAAAAAQAHYGAGLEQSVWRVEGDKHRCALSHDIPHLGQARFIQAAGQSMLFSIAVPPEGQFAQHVVLRAVPPLWRHDAAPVAIGGLALQGERPLLEVAPEEAQRLYQALESGLFAELLFLDQADAVPSVRVTISAVRFRTVLKSFQTCQAGLIELPPEPKPEPTSRRTATRTANQVTARHPVAFGVNSFELTDTARDRLLELTREYRAGPASRRILIAGHSGAQDDPVLAQRLAVRRAQEIRGFLVRRGLPAERIQLRSVTPAPEDAAVETAMSVGATLWMVQ